MNVERNLPTERRIAAVELLMSLGYKWGGKDWKNTRADSGEAVAWQYRNVTEEGPSTFWHDIDNAQFDLLRNDRRAEVRELFTHPRATAVDVRSLAFAAIEAEPELTDEMPDEMWLHIRDDRDAVTEALRITVRQTKQGIRDRLHAAIASREGEVS